MLHQKSNKQILNQTRKAIALCILCVCVQKIEFTFTVSRHYKWIESARYKWSETEGVPLIVM